jgi:hypothetical protein
MSDPIEQHLARISNGSASAQDFQALRKYVSDGGREHLYEAITAYLELAPVVDWAIAAKFSSYGDDPMVAAAAISSAGLRGCPEEPFWTVAKQVALGAAWDSGNDARVQALLVLHKVPGGCDAEVKNLLLTALADESPSVRDSAAIAAQRCFGVGESDIVVGGEDGTLFQRVPHEVAEWLVS